jgi:DNA-binding CsgD family transcriptional regulator
MSPASIASIAGVAQAASEPLPPDERARAVLEALRLVVPYDCAELSAWHPSVGRHSVLASVGYDERLLEWLNGRDRVGELDEIDLRESGEPMRLSELPAHGKTARTVLEYLLPAGFREGLTVGLRTTDGRYVGMLDMSSCDSRHPNTLAREAIRLLRGTLANVVDPARTVRLLASMLEPGSSAVTLRDGAIEPLDGFSPGPVLTHEHPALAAAQSFARSGRAQQFLALGEDDGTWFRVRLYRCELDGAWVVAASPTTRPYELTRREIGVLTLLVAGRSNPEIAAELVVSPRTISSHVEHILEKLAVPTRAAAAARAVSEGLLLPVT